MQYSCFEIQIYIPTTFPFDAGSRVDNVRHTSGYAGYSIKRKYCRNDQTNDNSFLNIINVNSTIQVRRVLWSGFYHTGSLLKQYKNEFHFVRRLKNFRYYTVFDNKKTHKKTDALRTLHPLPVVSLRSFARIYGCKVNQRQYIFIIKTQILNLVHTTGIHTQSQNIRCNVCSFYHLYCI